MILIEKNIDRLRSICSTYHVEKMYLFGSALNSDFNDKSDIDFLVKFKSFELSQYFENYINLKENLKKLFGREIDLVEEQTLKNPILIKSINKSKELIYG
ncbi:nucleotidyltransferase domain-containing protein [Flavobacterium ovatum]|uniref:nucleotidyltransferase family protein n=1 Tax=Flavobacterium ovatum TaxID=1928857 RepID=UPI00344C727A